MSGFDHRDDAGWAAVDLPRSREHHLHPGIVVAAGLEHRDRPIVYLYHREWLWAHTSRLQGFTPVPDGMVRLQGLKLN